MNVEIGAEAAQFPEKEYINGIFVAVHKDKKRISDGKGISETDPGALLCAAPVEVGPRELGDHLVSPGIEQSKMRYLIVKFLLQIEKMLDADPDCINSVRIHNPACWRPFSSRSLTLYILPDSEPTKLPDHPQTKT
jgi:hypothetical protein